MTITVKKLYDRTGKETGAILRAEADHGSPPLEKNRMENTLIEYACTELFRNQPITLFVEKNVDIPCIIVLGEGDNLEQTIIEVDDY